MENQIYRDCPICNNKIYYRWKSDFYTARKKNSKCKKCSTKKTQFTKKHKLNDIFSKRENSLDNLLSETPQSFYWLGFLIADAYLKDNSFEICLSEKDKQHLVNFSNFISYNKEIKFRSNTKSYRIAFNNKNSIPLFMEKYGIENKKTYNPIDFSHYKKYNKNLLICLLIGIIDGDGYICNNGSINSFIIKITSHNKWYNFYENILNHLDIKNIIKKVNNRNVISINISKKEVIDTLTNIIKYNKLPILERKWKDILNQRNNEK